MTALTECSTVPTYLVYREVITMSEIREVAVSKESTDKLGWTHIKKKHITGEIGGGDLFSDVYGISDEKTIIELIKETLENGKVHDMDDGWLEFKYYPYPDKSPTRVVANNGEIWTAYPCVRCQR